MELTRNKIIFFIIGGIITFLFLIILIIMFFSGNNNSKRNYTSKDFVIWTVGEDLGNIDNLISNFQLYSGTKTPIIFESFNSYEDYSLALTRAISSGTAPDIFILNNNEKNSVFENQVVGIPPNVISPDFFRKNYKNFISEQMISKNENGTEFLIGLPVGYETLGIFYNSKFVNLDDLSNFGNLNYAISRIKEKDNSFIPITIGNGSTVNMSEDIITQFIISEGQDRSLSTLSRKSIQKGIVNYLNFGDSNGNGYNGRFREMKLAGQKGVDLFSLGESFMIIGYPRLINEIYKKSFSPNILFAAPLPNDSSTKATLVNYNYFVINKDSTRMDLAEKFIGFLGNEGGIKAYLDTFPYYLPAYIPLEKNMDSQKIHSKFNIKIRDFYSDSYNYTSFDKGIKIIYDEKIKEIFDNESTAIENFMNFQKILTCKTNKIINQTDFSKSCE